MQILIIISLYQDIIQGNIKLSRCQDNLINLIEDISFETLFFLFKPVDGILYD